MLAAFKALGFELPEAGLPLEPRTVIIAMAVGLITEPRQAEAIVASGQALLAVAFVLTTRWWAQHRAGPAGEPEPQPDRVDGLRHVLAHQLRREPLPVVAVRAVDDRLRVRPLVEAGVLDRRAGLAPQGHRTRARSDRGSLPVGPTELVTFGPAAAVVAPATPAPPGAAGRAAGWPALRRSYRAPVSASCRCR